MGTISCNIAENVPPPTQNCATLSNKKFMHKKVENEEFTYTKNEILLQVFIMILVGNEIRLSRSLRKCLQSAFCSLQYAVWPSQEKQKETEVSRFFEVSYQDNDQKKTKNILFNPQIISLKFFIYISVHTRNISTFHC